MPSYTINFLSWIEKAPLTVYGSSFEAVIVAQKANLSGADLQGADLSWADLLWRIPYRYRPSALRLMGQEFETRQALEEAMT